MAFFQEHFIAISGTNILPTLKPPCILMKRILWFHDGERNALLTGPPGNSLNPSMPSGYPSMIPNILAEADFDFLLAAAPKFASASPKWCMHVWRRVRKCQRDCTVVSVYSWCDTVHIMSSI